MDLSPERAEQLGRKPAENPVETLRLKIAAFALSLQRASTNSDTQKLDLGIITAETQEKKKQESDTQARALQDELLNILVDTIEQLSDETTIVGTNGETDIRSGIDLLLEFAIKIIAKGKKVNITELVDIRDWVRLIAIYFAEYIHYLSSRRGGREEAATDLITKLQDFVLFLSGEQEITPPEVPEELQIRFEDAARGMIGDEVYDEEGLIRPTGWNEVPETTLRESQVMRAWNEAPPPSQRYQVVAPESPVPTETPVDSKDPTPEKTPTGSFSPQVLKEIARRRKKLLGQEDEADTVCGTVLAAFRPLTHNESSETIDAEITAHIQSLGIQDIDHKVKIALVELAGNIWKHRDIEQNEEPTVDISFISNTDGTLDIVIRGGSTRLDGEDGRIDWNKSYRTFARTYDQRIGDKRTRATRKIREKLLGDSDSIESGGLGMALIAAMGRPVNYLRYKKVNHWVVMGVKPEAANPKKDEE